MRIEHVAVYVNDIERARDFFVRYFGARPDDGYQNKTTGFRSYFLSFEDGARLEVMNRPEVAETSKQPISAGYIHIAFSVGGKDAVDRLTAELKADGFDVVSGPRTTGDGYYESCIVGIEGNLIEITV